jgi:hypothetical protein
VTIKIKKIPFFIFVLTFLMIEFDLPE